MSKTQENLVKAITGESLARAKYTRFAIVARKEGYEGIARIFEETAANEYEHAEREMEFLKEKSKVTSEIEFSPIGKTADNLQMAADGENFETSTMYPGFEQIARDENETEIADIFKEIGEVEEKHRNRYLAILEHVSAGTVFKREGEIEWKCLNCGYVHSGKEAPDKCPACGKPQSWYEPRGLNW